MQQLLESFKTLHDLRQVVHATSHPELTPFVALAYLRRRPSLEGKRKGKGQETDSGEIEWVVCVGAVGVGTGDMWWTSALTLPEAEQLIDVRPELGWSVELTRLLDTDLGSSCEGRRTGQEDEGGVARRIARHQGL